MIIRVGDIVDFLGDRVIERRIIDDNAVVTGQADIGAGSDGSFAYASRADDVTERALREVRHTMVVTTVEAARSAHPASSVVMVADPRLEFVRCIRRFFVSSHVPHVAPSAVIDPTATIGPGARISPGVVVEAGCSVGERVCIGPNAVLLEGSVLGNDVRVGAGTVIGGEGFGYVEEADGTPVRFPHVGGVRVGDRVEIGANTAIDRGSLEDTVICDDAKIDNLVHIAHNCWVGPRAFVIATAILCGGVRVGEGAWVAPNAAIRDQVQIGDHAVVGLSSTVIRDVDPGSLVVGSPAVPRAQ